MRDSKNDVIIYDYVDETVPVLLRVFKKRQRSYRVLGYQIEDYYVQISFDNF